MGFVFVEVWVVWVIICWFGNSGDLFVVSEEGDRFLFEGFGSFDDWFCRGDDGFDRVRFGSSVLNIICSIVDFDCVVMLVVGNFF